MRPVQDKNVEYIQMEAKDDVFFNKKLTRKTWPNVSHNRFLKNSQL